jgi:flagellar biogenesis protein FliO
MSNCDACKEIKKTEPVPYIVHESAQARNERTVKRLVVALIVSIALIFASNAIWLYAWMQYDYSSEQTESVTVDGKDGVANYIGNDGDIVNGEDYGN